MHVEPIIKDGELKKEGETRALAEIRPLKTKQKRGWASEKRKTRAK